MKTRIGFLAAALSIAASSPLAAQDNAGTTPAPSSQDQTFIRNASQDGATEVALGKLALEHATLPATRQMAQRLVDDHTKANRQLADIARREHVDAPGQPDPAALAKARSWTALQGQAFDHAYADAMVTDHRKAIALFTDGAQSSDADIQRFARNTLPTLKDHLSMATRLAGGDSSSSEHMPAPERGGGH